MLGLPRSYRVAATIVFSGFLVACADDPSRVTSPGVDRSPSSDPSLPHLTPGGTLPTLIAGGTAPSVPVEWKSRYEAQVRSATKRVAAKDVIINPVFPGIHDAQHFRHILLENTATGDRALWVISVGAIVNSASLGNMPATWHITGAGDFNADRKEDILWENTADGSRAVWLMDGSGGVLATVAFGIVPTQWHMSGAGDYNADGKDDILWENTTDGSRVLWIMNGGSVLYTVSMGTLPTQWHMIAANDYNSDGKDDIILENNSTGLRALWIMNGAGGVAGSVSMGTMPANWKIAGGGDIDGEYREDIVLENTTDGTRAAWLENGFARVLSAPVLTVLDPSWHMAAVLNPDIGDKTGTWTDIANGPETFGTATVMCALRTGGVAYCWGHDQGTGAMATNFGAGNVSSGVPLPVATRKRFGKIAVGGYSVCGLDALGRAYCWGNLSGNPAPTFMLGNGSSGGSASPVRVQMPDGVRFTEIMSGWRQMCALGENRELYCWGDNWSGEAGPPSGAHTIPAFVAGSVYAFATGPNTSCALNMGSLLSPNQHFQFCWGSNDHWQFGNGSNLNGIQTPGPSPTPSLSYTPVFPEVPVASSAIAVGKFHGCVINDDQVYVSCWGFNNGAYGELGSGSTSIGTAPGPIHWTPAGTAMREIVIGEGGNDDFNCILSVSGQVYCWGDGYFGALGNGTSGLGVMSPRAIPVSMPEGVTFTHIGRNGHAVYAITAQGAIYWWGQFYEVKGSGSGWMVEPLPTLVPPPEMIVPR